MNIGDKVRAIHGKEEGVVVGFTPKGLIEVMLGDGFRIPFSKSDLVVVSALEDKAFHADKIPTERPSSPMARTVFSEKGIFLAKTLDKEGTHAFHLLNNTDFQLLFTSFLLRPNQDTKTLAATVLNKKTSIQLYHTEQASLLDSASLLCQILFFAPGRSEVRPPLVKEIELKAKWFKGDAETLPILEKKGTKIQLDLSLTSDEWKNVGTTMSDNMPPTKAALPKPASEIDLHIEKLFSDYHTLKPEEMLRYQLRAFENHLEKSISAGLKETFYIHGVGNGVLKTEIHKKLSTNIFVKHFEDARKDKYGYGATRVVLK